MTRTVSATVYAVVFDDGVETRYYSGTSGVKLSLKLEQAKFYGTLAGAESRLRDCQSNTSWRGVTLHELGYQKNPAPQYRDPSNYTVRPVAVTLSL